MMIIKAFTNQNTIFYIIAINIICKFNFNFIHQDQVKFQFFKLSSELEFFSSDEVFTSWLMQDALGLQAGRNKG